MKHGPPRWHRERANSALCEMASVSGRIRAWLVPIAALALLAGCVPLGGTGGKPRPAPARIVVSDQRIVIAGPWGFCVDPTATHDKDGAAFVLLGNCAAISRSVFSPQPQLRAVLTAAVARKTPGMVAVRHSLKSLDRFFHSEQGRMALSQSGKAEGVQVLASLHRRGTLFIDVKDPRSRLTAATSDESWRAYFDLNGRIVAISVIGLAAEPIARSDALAILTRFQRSITRASKGLAKQA